jgi:3-hydroxy acid dehydrogenase / malonic semialdehyde reductase
MGTLSGQAVLVTGASSGIGRAVSVAFAKEGCRLILLARREDRLAQLAKELQREYGTPCLPVPVDLRDRERVLAALTGMDAAWQAIDVLVNNAGLVRGLDPLHEGSLEDWDEVLEVNLKALLLVTRWTVPKMVERGAGHIINIGSIAGYETYPGGAVYCASKFAVRALTRGLKMDLQGTPLRVTSVDPGLVETEFSMVRYRGDKERASAPYRGIKPLSGEDVAEAVVWCAGRPAHVNVMNMVILPTAQASASMVRRSIP